MSVSEGSKPTPDPDERFFGYRRDGSYGPLESWFLAQRGRPTAEPTHAFRDADAQQVFDQLAPEIDRLRALLEKTRAELSATEGARREWHRMATSSTEAAGRWKRELDGYDWQHLTDMIRSELQLAEDGEGYEVAAVASAIVNLFRFGSETTTPVERRVKRFHERQAAASPEVQKTGQ